MIFSNPDFPKYHGGGQIQNKPEYPLIFSITMKKAHNRKHYIYNDCTFQLLED